MTENAGSRLCVQTLRSRGLNHEPPYSWDEHAVYSPDGQKIAWISSLPFPNIIPQYGTLPWSEYRDYLHNEFFLMNANGTGVQQLTWFNTPGSPDSSPQFGDVMYAEWNLAGTQLLIHNGTPEIQVPGGTLRGSSHSQACAVADR